MFAAVLCLFCCIGPLKTLFKTAQRPHPFKGKAFVLLFKLLQPLQFLPVRLWAVQLPALRHGPGKYP
ncbi:MAG: hypothetical protein PWQ08_872 [Clostridiales bacterium]|nr:hypothetical protein [Clostridiales bacterium]